MIYTREDQSQRGDQTRRYLDDLTSQIVQGRHQEGWQQKLRETIMPALIVLAAAELRTNKGSTAERNIETRASQILGVELSAVDHQRNQVEHDLSSDTYIEPFNRGLAFSPAAYVVLQENLPEGFEEIRTVVEACNRVDVPDADKQHLGTLATAAWAAVDVQAVKL